MFGERFKRRFALTDQGVTNVKKGALWTIAVNLIDFAGIVFLYQLMAQLVMALTEGGELPSILPYAALLVAFVVVCPGLPLRGLRVDGHRGRGAVRVRVAPRPCGALERALGIWTALWPA